MRIPATPSPGAHHGRNRGSRKFHASTGQGIGWPTIVGLGAVVVAFMVLSLCVTATGTARFATNVGYDATVGYAVGAIFDLAKGMLPIGVLALVARRALGTAVLLGAAWICLAAYSCLATHATVSTAISSIERTGTWKMEVRGNDKAELASVEQQLATSADRCRRGPLRPSGGLGRRARVLRSLEGQPGVRHYPGKRPLRQGMRASRPAAPRAGGGRGLRATVRTCRRAAQRSGSCSHRCHLGPASRGVQRHPGPRAASRGHGRCGDAAHTGRRDHQLLWPRGPKGARHPWDRRRPSGSSGDGSPAEAVQGCRLEEGPQHTRPAAGPRPTPNPP